MRASRRSDAWMQLVYAARYASLWAANDSSLACRRHHARARASYLGLAYYMCRAKQTHRTPHWHWHMSVLQLLLCMCSTLCSTCTAAASPQEDRGAAPPLPTPLCDTPVDRAMAHSYQEVAGFLLLQ